MTEKIFTIPKSYEKLEKEKFIVSTNKCEWKKIFYEDVSSGKIEVNPLFFPQYEKKLIIEIFKRINPNLPQYQRRTVNIAITGTELGLGKSETAISLAYFLDPFFSHKDIAMSLEDWTKRILERRKNYFIVGDEPQDWMSAYDWQLLRQHKIARILETQRGKGASFLWALPMLNELFLMAKRVLQYVIHLRYRCPYHVHGYVWEKLSQPAEVSLVPVGRFTWPNPNLGLFFDPNEKNLAGESFNEILNYYRNEKKEAYMEEGLEDLDVEVSQGGLSVALAKEFIEWARENKLDTIQRGALTLWIGEKGLLTLPKAKEKEIWEIVKFLASNEFKIKNK
ncbi:MAG: hypothetical protein QXT31_03940 [Candidatus Bathyarchaeia archaeon]